VAAAAQTDSVGPPILKAQPTSQLPALHHSEAQKRAAHAYSPPHGAQFNTASLSVYTRGTQPISGTAPTAKDPGDGFDYGAAAIGAGVAAAIALLVTGSIVAVLRRGQLQHS
jgi:hypothetical protein